MRNTKNVNRIILIALLIIVFIVFLAKPIYTALISQDKWSNNDPNDYRALFKHDVTNLLLFNTIESQTREPEAQYIFNDNFNVFVTKFRINNTFNFGKDIVVKDRSMVKVYNDLYFQILSAGSKIDVRSRKLPLTNNIELNVENDNVKKIDITLNKMVLYAVVEKFSLIINQNQKYMVAEAEQPNYPVAIAFIKKNNLLYYVLMTPTNKNVKMQTDQLTTILN